MKEVKAYYDNGQLRLRAYTMDTDVGWTIYTRWIGPFEQRGHDGGLLAYGNYVDNVGFIGIARDTSYYPRQIRRYVFYLGL